MALEQEKNEMIESAKNELQKRMLSPIFGTFLIYWFIFHWQFLVTLFFVSAEQIWVTQGMLKAQYLKSTFANPHDWYFYISWALPVTLTYLTIWHFPKWFVLKADQKDTDYRVDRENIRLRGKQQLIREETKVEQLNIDKLSEESIRRKKQTEIKNILTDDEKWELEFEQFKKHHLYSEFSTIIKSVYKNAGYFQNNVEPDVLAIADSKGLVDLDSENMRISLTKKGKIFADKFLETNTLFEGEIDPRTIPF